MQRLDQIQPIDSAITLDGFEIAIMVVGVLALIAAIWGGILQLMVYFKYTSNNQKHIGGKTARQLVREMLDNLGYTDIEVRQTSYLWFIFFPRWGNRYSPRRKAIFLYKNIIDSDSVTAVSLAAQKVGLVVQHREGDRKMKFRAKWETWTRMAPNLFLPIITLGLLIDILVNYQSGNVGTITLIFVGLSVVYTIIAMVALFYVIPTERRAGEIAYDHIEKNRLVPDEFLPNVKSMFATYVKSYVADFVLAVLNLVIDILWLVSKVKK